MISLRMVSPMNKVLPIAALCLLGLAGCQRHGTDPAPATLTPAGQVDRARLLAADREPGQWLSGGGGWQAMHYSALADLTPANVTRLGFAWAFDTGTRRGLEATPVVVDGVMYASGVAGRVYALDAASGTLRWRFEPEVDLQVTRGSCCDQVNRGVAVWRGRVYVGALDGWLYALDAADGQVLWKADTFVDRSLAYTTTCPPQDAGAPVVIGNGGAEFDARGYFSAYDLDSGALRWRFYTVPGDPARPREHPDLEIAARTWDPNSAWQYGGGGTVWDGMAYDPELDLLYVGVGNTTPYPQWVRSPAGGDNLFTDSLLAINPRTGRLVWYYQQTPGDQWDIGSNAPMILVDREIDGQMRKLLLHAPRTDSSTSSIAQTASWSRRSRSRRSTGSRASTRRAAVRRSIARPWITATGRSWCFPRSSARTAGSRWPTARRPGSSTCRRSKPATSSTTSRRNAATGPRRSTPPST